MSEIPEDILPVGYVTKNELTKLRLGASCVDLFGQVVPKGFEMVPLYSAPVSLSSELDRLREALEEIVKPVEFMRRRADAAGSKLDGFMAITLAKDPEYLRGIARAALSPDNSTQKKEG